MAFLGRSFSAAEIQKVAAGSGALAEAAQAVVEDLLRQDDGNAHVDTTAFVSLNTMDCAGLQVLTKGDDARWVDMPVLPGGVCVNVVRSQTVCLRFACDSWTVSFTLLVLIGPSVGASVEWSACCDSASREHAGDPGRESVSDLVPVFPNADVRGASTQAICRRLRFDGPVSDRLLVITGRWSHFARVTAGVTARLLTRWWPSTAASITTRSC